MIVVTEEPLDIVLTGNPVVYGLRAVDTGGAALRWRGAYSELLFDGYYAINTGGFTINWQPRDGLALGLGFGAVAVPSGITEIPDSAAGFPSVLAYYEAVAAIVQAHPWVAPALRIYAEDRGGGLGIRLVAEAVRPEAGWSVGWGNFSTPGDTSVVNVTDVSTTVPTGYRLHLALFVEQTYGEGDYVAAGSLSSGIAEDATVLFDISGLLHDAVLVSMAEQQRGPAIPPFGATGIRRHDVLRRWYAQVYETTTLDDDDYNDSRVFDPVLAMLGGIAQGLYAEFDLFDNMTVANAFLTWKPDRRTLGIRQPEWLAWYNYTPLTQELIVRVIEIEEDGTESAKYTYDLGLARLLVAPHEVMLVAVSPSALLLAEETVKYTVQIVDATSRWEDGDPTFLSQERLYYVDRCHYHEENHLMYLNGFYCPEVLRCLGTLDVDMESSAQESLRVMRPGAPASFAEMDTYRVLWNARFTYRSGHLSTREVEVLQEILTRRVLYEVYTEGYIPLHLAPTSSTLRVYSSRQNLYGLELACEPALRPRHYSNDNMTFTEPDFWATDEGDFWQRLFGQPWLTA